ncbi:hypothetical protein ACRAWG_16150 [Methylobacterium sp. P31]
MLVVGWWIFLRRWSVQACHNLPKIRALTRMRLQPCIDDLPCSLCKFFDALCGHFQWVCWIAVMHNHINAWPRFFDPSIVPQTVRPQILRAWFCLLDR